MLKKIRKYILVFILFFFVSSITVVIAYRWIPIRYTPLMAIRYFENIDNPDFENSKIWRSYNDISHELTLAVMASEDNHFSKHNGFDWDAIDAAMKHNKKNKRKRGASTISQQTAKNVFLYPSRTRLRKGLEAYFTVLIEFFWSKERIMEVYLNIIETGNGVYGVEAASLKYFKKPAKKLNRHEAALIAAILPNPKQRNPAAPTAYLRQRQTQIVRLIGNLGKIDLKDIKQEQ